MSQRRYVRTLATCLGLVCAMSGTNASRLAAQLTGPPVQYWHENVPGVWDDAVQNDHFGSTLATGDFNGDGVDDLAIGVSNAQVGFILGAGAVHVLYGRTGTALFPLGQYWYQNLITGATNERDDRFGSALASGDFDGDGFDDLAIGSPGERIDGYGWAGQVQVLFGSSSGLSNSPRAQLWHQDMPG
ncbi:MAG TPA: FG-GAP repeat protein, partial [Thermoanaerobaculia bacterium]|nr:FG-GAP repeat protein [Thermoanaerobaculia bacterium]